jgi:hypothetical protein
MAYDQAIAHCRIGQHLPGNDPGRQEHLSRAVKIFTQLGATYDLKHIQDTLM